MTKYLTAILALSGVLALVSCNTHPADDCYRECDPLDEERFALCVAQGGGPEGDCRPGNRKCCALALRCVGDIGDQVVEPIDGCEAVEVPSCGPPCDLLPPGALESFDLCVEEGYEECVPGDTACCALYLSCVGSVGGVVLEAPAGASCCGLDVECEAGSYCSGSSFACAPAACTMDMECLPNRQCVDDECKCLAPDGSYVVHCPDGTTCGPDGACEHLCDPSTPDSCGEGYLCLLGVCFRELPPGPCSSASPCPGGQFCDLERGVCNPCMPGLPDLCDFADTDCDGSIDEDCCTDPTPELCNGLDDDCDGTIDNDCCTEPLPEICNGLDDDCDGTIDNACIPVEICDNDFDDDSDGFYDCSDIDCMTFPACACDPTATEFCNGFDDDCDSITDESDPLEGMPCGSDVGRCTSGIFMCVASAGLVCSGIAPGPELCNFEDDDCNGSIDDGPGPSVDCDDGRFCNGVEFCGTGGSCFGDGTTPCFDGNECTEDAAGCSEIDGCTYPPVPAGTMCMSDFVCDGSGMCIIG